MTGPVAQQAQGVTRARTTILEEDYAEQELVVLFRELREKTDRIGVQNETREVFDQLEDIRTNVAEKVFKLNLLEAIAMESNNPNIKELRESLFATVQMVHGEFISEEWDNMIERINHQYSSENVDFGRKPSPSRSTKLERGTILERIRRSLESRKQLSKQVKNFRKKLKKVQQNQDRSARPVSNNDTECCDSSSC